MGRVGGNETKVISLKVSPSECLFLGQSGHDFTRALTGNQWQTDARNKFRCRGFVGSTRSDAMPQSSLFKSSEQPVGKTPACPNCGRAMWLYDVARTGTPGREQLTFSCSECAQQCTAVIEYEDVASAS